MSRIIAASAIGGAHELVERAASAVAAAKESLSADTRIEFPNTAYYLPVIHGLSGEKVERLSDMDLVVDMARELLPDAPAERVWLPYLGGTLDAGIAALFAEELLEALKYVTGPSPVDGIWLGAADDVIMRAKGVEFVDGSAPGFAAVAGTAPDAATAAKLAREMQEKGLYVFMAGHHRGTSFAEQLAEEGVQLGWDTRLVPFGKEITAHIYSLGFATRAAMAFGGIAPGDYERILRYNKNRVFAFVMALGEVTDEWYATAAGAISYGFPTIADSDIPEILPTGVCTYEHVVSNIPLDEIVQRAIEVRGLKIKVTEIPIPVAYSPAFEGERIRKEDTYAEMGGGRSPAFEWLSVRDSSEVTDGRIHVEGPDLDGVEAGSKLPLGLLVTVAGRKMQSDFEPVVERQFHHLINYAEGVLHIGQRDMVWMRVSNAAFQKGFRLAHLGEILRAKLLEEFSAIIDKVEVTVFTRAEDVERVMAEARESYEARDARMAGLTDESVEDFYSCSLCQSFAPNHICMITPERLGLCGAYNWLDGKASYELNPSGPNQPVPKGETIDLRTGQWAGINEFVHERSNRTVERFNAYSLMEHPMTSCGCFMCIVAVLPSCNGVMIVNREHSGMTPCGMKFSTLAGTVGGGVQMPGFMGIGRGYVSSKKFIQAEGGLHRVAWMTSELKEALRPQLQRRCEELGTPEFLDMIADESVGETEEAVLEFMTEVGHPALTMDPLF
ncbi:MAG: CO dehydrogenase/CO-methylating acetyl-CoA synthase complex subunit beta [Coriobacteriia bacterium]|nr:CO dehydrogenase/CO-methylating acetyl-CoA synthase complex subunit beta [Coriobacteriia bacterium]